MEEDRLLERMTAMRERQRRLDDYALELREKRMRLNRIPPPTEEDETPVPVSPPPRTHKCVRTPRKPVLHVRKPVLHVLEHYRRGMER